MRVKIDPDGLSEDATISERQVGESVAALIPTGELAQVAGRKILSDVIGAAMAGTIPLDRPLTAMEPKKFTALHINIVLDRGSGFKAAEISEKYDMHQVYVNVILRHPFARAILHAMLGLVADKITEPLERLKSYAHEMIDTKISILRTSTNNHLRDRIASDILDRAGFGARTQVEATHVHRFSLPVEIAQRMSSALDESLEVAEMDYSKYVDSTSQESEAAGSGLSGEPEQLALAPGASHGASPVDAQSAERVA